MLDRSSEAIELTRGMTRAQLEANRVLFLAVVHLVEIVGEAANRVRKDDQAGYPDIEWKDIVGVRNRLIHGYDSVDVEVLWGILTTDLPALVASLKAYLEKG
jgi:uncharacterized protein with HEPN domain